MMAMMTAAATTTMVSEQTAAAAASATMMSGLSLLSVEHQTCAQQEGKAGDARNKNTIHGKPPKGNPNTLRFIREPLGSDRRLPYLQPSAPTASSFTDVELYRLNGMGYLRNLVIKLAV